MQLGIIGAGHMGGNMAIRLMKAGHNCVVYARHEESIKEAVDQGAKGTTDLKEFVRLLASPELSEFAGRVSDSGEGRWTVQAAVDEGVPVPVISSALFGRFSSRGRHEFADKLMSAMRYEFGGHLEKSREKAGGKR